MIKDHVYNFVGNSVVNSGGHSVWRTVHETADTKIRAALMRHLLNATDTVVKSVVHTSTEEAVNNLDAHD